MQEKILVGHKLRRFRQSLALSQTVMAESLNISPSYLNLLEHNQRPLTVSLLLRLGNAFDIDLKDFAEDDSAALTTELSEAFADPVLAGERISRRELQDLITAAPGAARGIANLFQAYRKVRAELEVSAGGDRRDIDTNTPVERVRDVLQQANNYFASLEQAAAQFRKKANSNTAGEAQMESLIAYAGDGLGLGVRVMPVSVMGVQLRRHDHHRREILISEALRRPQRQFHLLVQLALISQSDLIDQICAEHGITDAACQSLFRVTLAGYFAGAVMMPYEAFLDAAKEMRYDLDLLGRRFGASFEQVCHRLTTLQRENKRGVPFFFLRIDKAGNVTKRFNATSFNIAEYGGSCPVWNLHTAFRTPGVILPQYVELPEGDKFFTLARTTERPAYSMQTQDRRLAIALGCEIKHAHKLVYTSAFQLTVVVFLS